MGQSPIQAAHSTRLAVETATATLQVGSPCSPYHSFPCSPAIDCNHLPEVATGEEWGSYLLRSLSHHQDDLKLEIDTAALATEVALQVLTSDHDSGRQNEKGRMRKLRLLPLSDDIWSGSGNESRNKEGNQPVESQIASEDKPIRKGRARMSQEKRKRLARRKEREAMLLGIPPKPVSAPPRVTQFPSLSPSQSPCTSFDSKQQPHHQQQWMARAKQQRDPQRYELIRSFTGSEGRLSSRGSIASVPSLVGDDSAVSTASSASPHTSPELNQHCLPPLVRVSNESIWSVANPDTIVPRLSLQPPSPQQSRSVDDKTYLHYSLSNPFRPSIVSTNSSTVTPPMMRWSTTQGLMTSQGKPLSQPRVSMSSLANSNDLTPSNLMNFTRYFDHTAKS